MRPLAVLILTVGAVAALIFALTSIMGDGGDSGRTNIVTPPAQEAAAVKDSGVGDLPPVEPAPRFPEPGADDRNVVEVLPGAESNSIGGIEGTVVDPDGQAVAGALIQLIRQKGAGQFASIRMLISNEPAPRPVKEMMTNEAGFFRFERVRPGKDWHLVANHDEFSRKVAGPIAVHQEGTAKELIKLDPGFEVYGYVLDASNRMALAGAQIILDNPAAAFLPSNRKSPDRIETVSGADGSFTIKNIPGDNRTVTVHMESYATRVDTSLVTFGGAAERRKKIDILMEPGFAIAGRVVDSKGVGVQNVLIDAIGNGPTTSSRGETVSTEGGEFFLADLAEGRYTLRVEAQGYDVDPLQADAGERDILIELRSQGALRGVVVNAEGEPVPSFALTVRVSHPTNRSFGHIQAKQTVSGQKDGSFLVEGLKADTYVVQADVRGYASSFSDPVVVEEGITTPDVLVRMSKGGTLIGQVIDQSTKEPIAGVKVKTAATGWVESEFTEILGALAPSALTDVTVRTDREGRFEIKLVTPDAYQLSFRRDGFTTLYMNKIQVDPDVVTDIGTVSMTAGATITGTAYLENGESAAHAFVGLRPMDNQQLHNSAKVRSDADGRFVLTNVAPGQYQLSCRSATKTGFGAAVDSQKSMVEIDVVDGGEYVQDLHIGGR